MAAAAAAAAPAAEAEAAATPAAEAAPPVSPPTTLDRNAFPYAACYCEENTYLLIRRLAEQHGSDGLYAVFVSNPERRTPIWRQRAASAAAGPGGCCVCWDYHSWAVRTRRSGEEGGSLVYDLDTTLEPFPVPFAVYRREALRPCAGPARLYRIVPAREMLASFSSDRSHMRTADGGWTAAPPAWAPIRGSGVDDSNTLPAFLDMRRRRREEEEEEEAGDAGGPGRLLDEREFFEFFSSTTTTNPP